MTAIYLESIQIELAADLAFLLWHESVSSPDNSFDVHQSPGPPLEFEGKSFPGDPADAPIIYDPSGPAEGRQAFCLFENTGYNWKLCGAASDRIRADSVTSTLEFPPGSEKKAEWNFTRLKGESVAGRFKVSNYLGTAEIRVGSNAAPIRFEVQSRKFDFHGEYSAMVQNLADYCQQLLLEWESPTAFNVAADEQQSKQLLLEQFLFLRHVLGNERIDLYLDEISRRPHTALVTEQEWKPASFANSPKFAMNPMRYGRDWRKPTDSGVFQVRGYSPAELVDERRFETFDTPPNRFVKFALNSFRAVCQEVIDAFSQNQGTAYLEAVQMLNALDVFLMQSFLADVGSLHRVPLDSQTVQKREGYREILHAWLMLEAATKLDWPGRNDVYDGTNRDAATLYEFWLYFVLLDVLQNRLQVTPLKTNPVMGDAKPFVERTVNGGVQINLRQGETSIVRFKWKSSSGDELGIHLFYNRTFKGPADPMRSGAYSRTFRPDFTVVFFPSRYLDTAKWDKAEELAGDAGQIGYLHFDAKYRIETIERLLGADDAASLDAESIETKSTDTYRRGDLYKMHTYNDAIRRTAGSYVLYPGRDGEIKREYTRYEEVIPGVGAFRLRPGNEQQRLQCEQVLAKFITDVLEHHRNKFSREYRIRHWTTETVKEVSPQYAGTRIGAPATLSPPVDTAVMQGYIRRQAVAVCQRRRIFYFHAVDESGSPTNFDPAVLHAEYLVPYSAGAWLGWYAEIKSCELYRRNQLIAELGSDAGILEAQRQYYFVVEFEEPVNFEELPAKAAPAAGAPVLCNWSDLYELHAQ
jgi:predicted component of viral defense system (DUF524 family)